MAGARLSFRRRSVQDASIETSGATSRWRLWIPFALCAFGFVGDFATPLGVADAFTYVIAVISCLWVGNPRCAYYIAGAGTVLILAGLGLAHGREAFALPITDANRLIGIITLWIVAGLVSWTLRAEVAMRRSREAARQALQAKSRFLAVASHDLRQPLQSVGMLSGALSRLASDPRVHEIVEQQQRALASATGLLNTLLDLSKLESGALKPTIEVVDLASLFARLGEELADKAREKNIRLDVQATRVRVRSDRQWLRQILQNLLTNALRYTPAGGEVSLSVRQQADAAEIEVRDTGPGIAADKLEHIFDEFYQIGQPAGERKGWGLGLSIVKHAAAMLGHQVKVRSELGHGATFTVALAVIPTSDTVASAGGAQQPVVAHKTGRGMRILLIDDDEAVAKATSLWLKTEGFRVDLAHGSADVARHLATPDFAPDVIVSDFHLREAKTGLDVVRDVRQGLKRTVPAIFVSGETQTGQLQEAGLDHVVIMCKPVDTDELLRTLERIAAEH
jgi:signal transduction histidine kinase/CheY-like chemotaxis protein